MTYIFNSIWLTGVKALGNDGKLNSITKMHTKLVAMYIVYL